MDNDVNVLRGSKYNEFTIKEPIDSNYYSGDIWNPLPNNFLIGEYVDVLTEVGKFNQSMYILDTDRLDKQFDKIFGCASLDRQMKQVSKGEIIEVKYIGKNEAKNYHEYKVSILSKEETVQGG